jgi:ABC-type Fe3+ transport system permease subunit
MILGFVSHFADACTVTGGSFFGFPKWYKYLPGIDSGNGCIPSIRSVNDVWLIAASVVELLLRVASLLAVGFVVYGGVQYILSQGEPDRTTKARDTIFNALIGLVIAVAATTAVTFVAGRFN